MPWETCVAHVAPESLGPWALRVEATPLSIITPIAMWVARTVIWVHPLIPSASLTACRRLKVSTWVA
jgi:hypothetical protein